MRWCQVANECAKCVLGRCLVMACHLNAELNGKRKAGWVYDGTRGLVPKQNSDVAVQSAGVNAKGSYGWGLGEAPQVGYAPWSDYAPPDRSGRSACR